MRHIAEPSFLDSRTPLEILLVLLIAAIGAAAVVFIGFRLKPRVLLAIMFSAAVVQFFGPFGFNSIALLAMAALLPGALWRFARRDGNLWLWLLAALAVWQTISVLWSDKIGSAAYGVLVTCAVAAAYLLARTIIRESSDGIVFSLAASAPFVLIAAWLVTLFRWFPDLERAYLTSSIARLFTEPGVELIASGSTENVNDPDKSGGLFLNANTASLFFAVVACLYLWAAFQRPDARGPGRKRFWGLIAVAAISLDASIGTGSKTPLALVVALPVVAIFILLVVRRPLLASGIAAAAVAAGVGAVAVVMRLRPGLLDEVMRTSGERQRLWWLVARAVPEDWFLGMGFGNWRTYIMAEWRIGFPTRPFQLWPPHNFLLQSWVDAGLISLLLTIALAAIPVVVVIRRAWRHRTDRLFSRGSVELFAVLVGLSWVIAHGMADTTTFVGDNHLIPFYGALTAIALWPRLGGSRSPGEVAAPGRAGEPLASAAAEHVPDAGGAGALGKVEA